MPTLIELATQVVTAQAFNSAMSTEQIVTSLTKIHSTLGQLESGVTGGPTESTTQHSALTISKAFKKNEIICMICGKGGFHILTAHIKKAHGLKPNDYRKKFAIPKNQPLCSKIYSDNLKERAANIKKYVSIATVKEPIPAATAVKVNRRGRPPKAKAAEVAATEAPPKHRSPRLKNDKQKGLDL